MLRWNIRNQILSAGGIGLLVILGVVVYFYTFSRGQFLDNSRELVRLTSRNYANEIEISLNNYNKTFDDWTKDDIFGLSIEFQTTSELKQQFSSWLGESDQFVGICLLDKNGRIVEIALKPEWQAQESQFVGDLLPQYDLISGGDERHRVFLQSTLLKEIGSAYTNTYAYYRPAFNSSGNFCGAVISFSSWDKIQENTEQCVQELQHIGYQTSSAALSVTNYDKDFISPTGTTVMETDMFSSIRSVESSLTIDDVTDIDFSDNTYLVGYNPLHSFYPDNDKQEISASLITIVPQQEVISRLNAELMNVLFIGGFGIFILLGVSYYIARRISTRIGIGTRLAEHLALGDTSQEISIHGSDEIGELGRSFTTLAAYIRDMSKVAEQIANGDLTVDVEPKSDQDMLGNSFKGMVNSLSDMISQLHASATELTQAAGEIAKASDSMSEGSSQQNEQVALVSTAIEEMTATIKDSAKNAGNASDGAKQASETATSGGDVVAETINGMHEISQVVREAGDSITTLAESVDAIGNIISVIDDIADQTNLLALNAAIEAARAGDQGRGFAVVADEVRKLAERTSKATGEISDMIKGIQSKTEAAVYSMENGFQKVDKGRELADKAGTSLQEIVTMSEQVMGMIQQIATSSEQQSSAVSQISETVENVSVISQEASHTASQTAAAAEQLNRQAESLNQLVTRFKM